ncbi:MAG: flagellar biosynthesis anti-sigma factor FlgM [Negativicutes bacterium]|nr:flagellar biosynthesis anti-sigma factor FlgM [Negativicutes bacterium]
MIISGNQIQNIMKVYADQNKVTKSAKSQGSSPTSKKDEVVLSTQAQEFGQIYQALKAMPDVRADKVQDVSDRIAQGNYSVEAKDVAEKMLGRIMADQMPK